MPQERHQVRGSGHRGLENAVCEETTKISLPPLRGGCPTTSSLTARYESEQAQHDSYEHQVIARGVRVLNNSEEEK